jgi:hypothetical protein
MEPTATRVARRYLQSNAACEDFPYEEALVTRSTGCSIGTWELMELLAAKGIDFTTLQFVPKTDRECEVRFVATDRAGELVCTGRVELRTLVTAELVTIVAEVALDGEPG